MVGIFDEIEAFFQQEQFSQEQLDDLKSAIESKHKDNYTRKAANSAINIKLLQYQLSGPVPSRLNEKGNKAKSLINVSKNKATLKLNKRARKKQGLQNGKSKKTKEGLVLHNLDFVAVFYKYNINQPVKKAALYLNLSLEKCIPLLKTPNNLKLDKNSKFTEEIWELNKMWISNRLNKIQKKVNNQKLTAVKKSRYSNTSYKGVFGELAKTKTIGSIIYTRM